MKKIKLLCLGLFGIALFQSCMTSDALRLYQVDPLKKVLKEQTYFKDEVDTILAVRGEYASIQIVTKGLNDVKDMDISIKEITSKNGHSLIGATAGWVGYVDIGRSYNPASNELIHAASNYFPDPILTDSLFSIEMGEVQPLWITVPIDKSAEPGIYKGVVEISGKVNGKNNNWKKDFYIKVYPITLEKITLYTTHWSGHFNAAVLSYLNNNEKVELYSPLYWELVEMLAKTMASHRQNVHRIFPVWNTQYTLKDGKYTFDFSRFDQEVEIYEKLGALDLISGGHLAWRSGNWDSPFYVDIPLIDGEESRKLQAGPNPIKQDGLRFVKLPIEDLRTQNFLNQFLPALAEHLKDKGWLDKYTQHIADEPVVANSASYGEISKYVRKYMPGVRLLDAVLTSKELAGTIDIWIPVLDVLHKDFSFYKELQKAGKEIWYYTCVVPKGNYANRYLEQPLIQTRYLHWINYKYDVTGYLHWGLNSWVPDQLNASQSRNGGKLPAGDNCIIYPGYRKVYSSIRYEAMRDGIDDYQLLRMLEKKNLSKAKSLANDIILNFNEYDGSVSYFRLIRKQLLDELVK